MRVCISSPVPYLFDFFFEYDTRGPNYGKFQYETFGLGAPTEVAIWWGHLNFSFAPDCRCMPLRWIVSKIPPRDELSSSAVTTA